MDTASHRAPLPLLQASSTGKVLGIGNPLIDIVFYVTSEFVRFRPDLSYGLTTWINFEEWKQFYDDLTVNEANKDHVLKGPYRLARGSIAASLIPMSASGMDCTLFGGISEGVTGDFYHEGITAAGVTMLMPRFPDTADMEMRTGRCGVLVTPDNERTMVVYRGCSDVYPPEHMDLIDWDGTSLVMVETYTLLDKDKSVVPVKTIQKALEFGIPLAFSLSDPECLRRALGFYPKNCPDFDLEAAIRGNFSVIFGNMSEWSVFLGFAGSHTLTENDILSGLKDMYGIAYVTLGAKGCFVVENGACTHVPAANMPAHLQNSINTTGAGDFFAGAVLHALSQGSSGVEAAHKGSQSTVALLAKFEDELRGM